MHRLSAENWYWPIIGQFANNRYRPFDSRHWPIIGRLFLLVDGKMFSGSQESRLRNSPSQAESDFRISVRSLIQEWAGPSYHCDFTIVKT